MCDDCLGLLFGVSDGLRLRVEAAWSTLVFVREERRSIRGEDANFAQVIVGVDPDPANNPRMIKWAKDYWLALHPYSAGGGYVNMMMDEGKDHVKAAYRNNYVRLAQIKAKYDPHNFFRINQNIEPGA